MSTEHDLDAADLALIIEALGEAAYFRDTRSRVVKRAVGSAARSRTTKAGAAADDHDRVKAQAYETLALKLRRLAERRSG